MKELKNLGFFLYFCNVFFLFYNIDNKKI